MLRKVLRSLRPSRTGRRKAARRPRYRAALEVLEGRLAPAVLTVNTLADETTADSFLSLREAISVVDAGSTAGLSAAEQAQVSGPLGSNDTIQFDPSLTGGTITLTGGALDITQAMTVAGPGPGSLTISGNNASRVLLVGQVWSPNPGLVVSLSGLTIAGGSATAAGADYGGGLLNFGTTTVSNCAFAGNAAGASGGGGAYNVVALALSGCTFTNNTVSGGGDGGGVYNIGSASLTVTGCTFTGNSATQGGQGAGLSNSGTAAVTASAFSGNTAGSNGGGIYNSTEGSLTVSASTFANNAGGSDGGGIDQDGTATISTCTLSGNSAASEGGGMDSRGPLTLLNCTVYGNTAVSDGGGLTTSNTAQITNCTITANRVTVGSGGAFGGGLAEAGVAAKLFNTIVAGNFQGAAPGSTASDIAGTVDATSASDLVGTGGGGGLSNGTNGNQVGVGNPGLGGLANNGGPTQTVALLPGSPAIDRGSNAYVTAGETDQRDLPRIVNGTVDIGAFEVQAVSAATSFTVTGFPSPTTAGVAGTFTVTVEDAHGNTFLGYRGTVHFTSSDPQAILPADYTFTSADNGVHTFTATLETAGAESITAADGANSLSASQTGIQVTPAAASTLVVAGYPTPTTAGVANPFTVTARDPYGNVATGYSGTVTLGSSDTKAVFTPASYTFTSADSGVHTFSGTLKTAGSQSITATDAANSLSASQTGIQVTPAAASTLVVAGYPTPTTAGAAHPFTVTAKDPYGNTATGYTGMVALGSSDSQAAFTPASYTFTSTDSGVHTFSGTLNTSGTQTITATDTATASITGTQSGIAVNPATNGAVITVNSVADNTAADSALTLREAVEYVDGTLGRSLTAGEQAQVSGTLGASNVIQFSLPAGPQTITLTGGALDITKAVTVNGPGAGLLTVSGNNRDRVFIIGHDFSQNLSLHVAMNGLTIAGGSAVSSGKNYGAGLLNFGTLTLSAMTFSGNTAGSSGGGGLYNDGSVTVSGSTFTGNTTTSGGPGAGIFNNGSGTLTVTGCTFTTNAANSGGEGGGLSNDGTASVSGSTFSNNTAGSNGAGIHNSTTGKLTLTNSTFTGGKAGSDGGAFDNDNTVTATGCTLANNTCGTEGGAIDNHAVLTLTNCTLVGNTAGSRGGAINNTAGRNSPSAQVINCTITGNRVTASSGGGGILQKVPVKLFNTIVAGNFEGSGSTPDDIAGGNVDSSSAFNLIGTGGSGGLSNGVNGNQVGVSNPGLGPLANNGGPTQTVALLPGSPAIDRGSNAHVTAGETDQRGLPRIVNGTVDIGAFEVQASSSSSVAGTSTVLSLNQSGVSGGTTLVPTAPRPQEQPDHHLPHAVAWRGPLGKRRTGRHKRGDGAESPHAGQ